MQPCVCVCACLCVFVESPLYIYSQHAAPEIGQLDRSSSHTLAQGEMTYITYPFEPDGVTLQIRVEEGTLDVFGSFNVRNPTQSTADFTFTAELQTTYYVSPETFENATGMQLNGRSARQVASENATTEHSLFISVSGLHRINKFAVTTVSGDDAGTFGECLWFDMHFIYISDRCLIYMQCTEQTH